MNKRLVIFVLLVLPLVLLAGCNKVEFTFVDFDLKHEITDYSESYSGEGTIKTNADGNYIVLIHYEKDGGKYSDDQGYYTVSVYDGEGKFPTYDYSLDVGELEKPDYEFDIIGYMEFSNVKGNEFVIDNYDIKINEDENYIRFLGEGEVKTAHKGIYLLLLKYEKDGGNTGNDEGYTTAVAVDGEGSFNTYDSIAVGESYDEPKYEFEIIGCIEFKEDSNNDFELDFSMEHESSNHSESYTGNIEIETNKKGAYLVIFNVEKDGGNELFFNDGYYYLKVVDGEGGISTYDFSYDIDDGEIFEKPEYEFEIIGYAPFKK